MQRHVLDEADQTVAAAADTLTQAHCVVTTGGVSAGQRDRLPDAWRSLGCRTVLHGVAIRPGKPLLVVTAPAGDPATVVLGLPGNPVSVLATAHLFVWPVLLRMMGADTDRTAPRWRQVALTEAVDTQSRREVFRAARLRGLSRAEVVTWHGSGDLMHTAQADGFVRLPQQDGSVPRETQVPFLPFICGAAAPRMRCED